MQQLETILISLSHGLIIGAAFLGLIRYRRLAIAARLIHASLFPAMIAETVGTFFKKGNIIHPNTVFNAYIFCEAVLLAVAAVCLLPKSRRLLVAVIASGTISAVWWYTIAHALPGNPPTFNNVAFLTQSVLLVAIYLIVLMSAFVEDGARPLSRGMLLLCVGVLLYNSLAPLAIAPTDYLYSKGKDVLSHSTYLINTVSSVFRYALTLAGFLLMPPAHSATSIPILRDR